MSTHGFSQTHLEICTISQSNEKVGRSDRVSLFGTTDRLVCKTDTDRTLAEPTELTWFDRFWSIGAVFRVCCAPLPRVVLVTCGKFTLLWLLCDSIRNYLITAFICENLRQNEHSLMLVDI